jgi:nucleoside-diphosphate-sugar epimerase
MALIGYTGFVGGNLLKQAKFDRLYNRANIENIGDDEFDMAVCAAPSAEKWRANRDPEADLRMVNELIRGLDRVKTRCFIQISTVDIYSRPSGVDEDTPVEFEGLHSYGRNRLLIEEFVEKKFHNHLVVRLPALFGPGLKKNFIFDLIHDNNPETTDSETAFQFYFIGHLWRDISTALEHGIGTLNITSEPVSAREIAARCFGIDFRNKTGKTPAKYDMRSRYAPLYSGKNGYMYNKDTVIKEIQDFLETAGKSKA